MAVIRNVAISASAGTGKTFALVTRYLGLLAAGVEPRQIVALTFTRKAAGEILERILSCVAQMASDDPPGLEALKNVNQALTERGFPTFTTASAQEALRRMVDSLPWLQIGTLDSFFLAMLRQFRLEWGFATDISITEDETEDTRQIVRNLLKESHLDETESQSILEAFKQATWGAEEKSIHNAVKGYLEKLYPTYNLAPEEKRWGFPSAIWGADAQRYFPSTPLEVDWAALREQLEKESCQFTGQRAVDAWKKYTELLLGMEHGMPPKFEKTLEITLLKQFFKGEGAQEFKYGRDAYTLSPETVALLNGWYARYFSKLYEQQVVQTHGIYKLLKTLEQFRQEYNVQTGRLAFSDVTQFLRSPPDQQAAAVLKTQMDYRMDSQFRHWLLDEFQDTSYFQWDVLENVLDEVIQDADGDRSLFYVGDTKQAIYEWRGGSPELFHRILAHYPPPLLQEDAPLTCSWRSSPVILNCVNQVFSGLFAVESLPETVKNEWCETWHSHQAARETLPGHAAVYTLPLLPADGDKHRNSRCRLEMTARLLLQLKAEAPNVDTLKIAIICRNNAACKEMLSILSANGIHAVWAGKSGLLSDNVLIPAILSWLKLADHPADQLARRHVEMCKPLSTVADLSDAGLRRLAQDIIEEGLAGFLARITIQLIRAENENRISAMETRHLRQLVQLAAAWEQQPKRPLLKFVDYVAECQISREQAGSSICVTTIHQAKGLEYDVVFLPDLQPQNGILNPASHAALVGEHFADDTIAPKVDWVLTSPGKLMEELDPVLNQVRNQLIHQAASGEIRNLYVAMTRAKYALYIVTTAAAEKTNREPTLRLSDIIHNTLNIEAAPSNDAPAWTSGRKDWFNHLPAPSSPSPPASAPFNWPAASPEPETRPPAKWHLPVSPSSTEKTAPDSRYFFSGREGRMRGTQIHSLLCQIEWAPDTGHWPPGIPPDMQATIREVLVKPADADHIELWREQPFEAILNDQWITGIFDRVHIWKNPETGQPLRAKIIDFKTDRISDDKALAARVEVYRSQMDLYRRAVQSLLHLSPAQVDASLLFLNIGRLVDL